MRELKRKMLLTLFSLFTILVLVVVAVQNYTSYLSEQDDLQRSLLKIADVASQMINPAENQQRWKDSEQPDLDRISLFYDNPAWIVVLANDRRPVVAYTDPNQETDVETLFQDANEIAHGDEPGSLHIGNLYAGELSWYYPGIHSIILVDTDRIQVRLLRDLFLSILIALVFEAGLYVICRKAANWMTAPIERSMEKQKQFIADASHELKTPVAIIQASAEAMEQDPQPRWIENIKEEAIRMNGLITNLLDLTRSEQAKVELVRTDLSKLVEKQCLIMEAAMFEKNLVLEEQIEPDCFVKADPAAMQQLCAILIDNAIAHSSGKVRVSLERKGRDLVFSVANTGVPIPPGEREKIFERFYRADTSRNRGAGRYGLGLAIAKSIAERHSGRIFVRCEEGWTSFVVILHPVQ